ncbi:MAG: excinuclease ABC subunit UvrA, partial [Gammaproteobacteria bacterium]|nr:excinuclease ABC subunit UvrA [Gammaproteobacteria bacterium]
MTIKIRGARQNSLKNLSLDLPANELIVITGVSGSGKSSLAFDTLFAEGQRRYVETFSPYARQFLDRMDKPAVDRIEGIPPSIAIDQTNPVRTSRSTVGTLTELTDHFKLLFAKASHLHCGECGRNVEPDHAEQVAQRVLAEHAEQRCEIQFDVKVPDNFDADEIQHWLDSQGYARSEVLENHVVRVTQDRLKLSTARQDRLVEALEIALHRGHGEAWLKLDDQLQRVSTDLSCQCGTRYSPPTQSVFSFNSPLGACDDCRGFGRVIGIDYGLVIPDHNLSIRDGAIKPFQTESNAVCQRDLMKYAKAEGIDVDCPWGELDDDTQRWVIDGAGGWNSKKWYGVARFFEWLEGRSYKMHVRVLLSRYRSYSACPTCAGARFKSSSLLWRIGSEENAKQVLEASRRFLPSGLKIDRAQLERWPGLHLHDLMQLPLVKLKTFIDALKFDGAMAAGTEQLLTEIRRRLSFLVDVGLGYLNLDRQSRTLSGGEVQRINLTTALGTSLVNTLFVLDEPSIGLHPRDIDRVVGVMQKLRDQGNTLVVVEHDPQIMLAANRIIDMGPGAGERGGEIIFNDVPAKLLTHPSSVTAQFLRRERRVDHGLSSRPVGHKTPKLTLRGARENNLQSVDLTLPLGHFICVTGVSGSGKSTLIHDTLYMAIKQQLGEPVEAPGAFESLEGMTHIGRVELIDQSPIGRTTRSTAATYTGAFEAIRKIFAKLPQSLERGYKLGTFSFSSGLRCPTCSGNGFEHVEMQFLSDVYLRCASCDGKRYTDELLEVVYTGADGRVCNIADVLALSVNEAMAVFADEKTIIKALKPLIDVGLDYVQLGQAVTTLSGGEAQRLKLAGHLAKMRDLKEPTLFLFDEPTTGLHFADTEKLLSSFDPLLEAGHTVLVIEHNLDVIQAADWIIDLGPEGGDQGGQIVFAGTVADIKQHADNHTGKSLVDYDAASLSIAEASPAQYQTNPAITVHGAREHN